MLTLGKPKSALALTVSLPEKVLIVFCGEPMKTGLSSFGNRIVQFRHIQPLVAA